MGHVTFNFQASCKDTHGDEITLHAQRLRRLLLGRESLKVSMSRLRQGTLTLPQGLYKVLSRSRQGLP